MEVEVVRASIESGRFRPMRLALFRGLRPRGAAFACACFLVLSCFVSVALADHGLPVERIEFTGLHRTRAATIEELLPRPPPTVYSDGELKELARRIGNLEIFDRVEVQQIGTTLAITVREKWTLVPEFDFATGTTPADTFALLGVTEYNFLGTASSLGLTVYRERRGFGFFATFNEHVYHRKRWALSAEATYSSSILRFRDGSSWFITNGLGGFWATSPPVLTDHLRYEVGLLYTRQTVSDVEGMARPPNGHALGTTAMLAWDTYEWHDLTPRGFLLTVAGIPSIFLGPSIPQNRFQAELEFKAAERLTKYTALMLRVFAGVMARGNPNHSLTLGSVVGVRGLEDAWYFNWAQAFANLELRQAIPLAARWAVQLVAFTDGAGFEQIDARGRRDRARAAFSGGGGVRVVPTWLSGFVLRFDVARLVAPERAFFYQFGVSQYF